MKLKYFIFLLSTQVFILNLYSQDIIKERNTVEIKPRVTDSIKCFPIYSSPNIVKDFSTKGSAGSSPKYNSYTNEIVMLSSTGEFSFYNLQGDRLAKYDEFHGFISADPAVLSDGTVVFGDSLGELYILDKDHKLKYRIPTGGRIDGNVVRLLDNSFMVGNDIGKIVHYSEFGILKNTFFSYGKTHDTKNKGVGEGICLNDTLVAFSGKDSYLLLINLNTNEVKYVKLDGPQNNVPAIDKSDNSFYIGTGSGTIYKISYQGDILKRLNMSNEPIYGSIVFDDKTKTVFVVTIEGSIVFLDNQLNIKSQKKISDKIYATPIIMENGLFVIGGEDKKMHFFKSSGELVFEINIDGCNQAQPLILPNGQIIFTTFNGDGKRGKNIFMEPPKIIGYQTADGQPCNK